MPGAKDIQLAHLVDSHDANKVFAEVSRIFALNYREAGSAELGKLCSETRRLFEGRFPGYRACNSEYHDFRHTLDVSLAAMRLVDGYNLKRAPLSEAVCLNLLQAALLHDSGYIQESWDTQGTGAKYASRHEERSIEFLRRHHAAFGVRREEVEPIERLIRATDLKSPFDDVPFASPEERIAGAILGTADLIGQMSDREYLEKLLFLYYEFKEAGIPGFQTEYDVLRKTGDFYTLTKQRLKESYLSVYTLARLHFRERHGVDANLYMIAIGRQMSYLRKIIRDESTNFRSKLKRGDRRRLQALSQRPWLGTPEDS